MKLLNICNKVIEYSFYLLFFLVPLAFTSDTSELFEFNKLWVTFIITIIVGFAWFTKMVIKREFRVQRTLLDIPIALFLISELISTFISLDTHVSIWGYYSRFNGGLTSILSYIFLYYAFVTNLKEEQEENKDGFDFKKIYIFVAAIIVFFIGALVSSQIKPPTDAGIPWQMFSNLTTVFVSFAIFMYAAPKGIIKKSLYAIFSAATVIVLWGLPSHFGYDPTCLLFRGTLDVSCWTNAFQPRVRIFSTLGQPDWYGAYLAVLIPILAGLLINTSKAARLSFSKSFSFVKNHNFVLMTGYFIAFVLFYLSLLYTQSRSAAGAIWIVIPVLLVVYFWLYILPTFDRSKLNLDFKAAVLIFVSFGLITFFAGQPFPQLNNFTFAGIMSHFNKPAVTKTAAKPTPTPVSSPVTSGELGGTDSGKIRQYVWQGALSIWKSYPIFGSGLETYAFAYYKFRPAGHNMTSEWKYLYNKAHNEYLNYLSTTGTVGLATYLFMIGSFLFLSLKHLYKNRKRPTQKEFLMFSVIGGYLTILVTNFFGFSVVSINIFFYLIPAFVFVSLGLVNYEKAFVFALKKRDISFISNQQKLLIGVISIVAIYMIYALINFWNADRQYYFGLNYDQAQDYQKAYTFLKTAVNLRPSEPTFKDEFAYNNAVLGAAIVVQAQKETTQSTQQQDLQIAKQLVDNAVTTTNQVTQEHPNDIVFWKTKVRIFYTLSQVDPTYLPAALAAIKQAAVLAPTDADVSYNLGILQGQNGDAKTAVSTLQNTIKLKPDYSGAYYALAIFYHQLAIDSKGKVINQDYNQKAIDEMNLLIQYFGPNQQASDAIKTWSK